MQPGQGAVPYTPQQPVVTGHPVSVGMGGPCCWAVLSTNECDGGIDSGLLVLRYMWNLFFNSSGNHGGSCIANYWEYAQSS